MVMPGTLCRSDEIGIGIGDQPVTSAKWPEKSRMKRPMFLKRVFKLRTRHQKAIPAIRTQLKKERESEAKRRR